MRRLFSVAVLVLCCRGEAAARSANSAADICAPSANPCVVRQAIDVAAGSKLDFGLRTLRIEGAGALDFEDGRGEVLCGRLETVTTGVAIRARAESSPINVLGISARKRCSDSTLPCLVDSDCAGAGSCSAGDGSIILHGDVLGSSDTPGHLLVRSASDIALHGEIAIGGTRIDSDGGSLALESTQGSVLLAGAVDASGGGGGCGGYVSLVAALDVAVAGSVAATGGEYDGGAVSIDAGRDVSVSADIAVDSTSGAGTGGEIEIAAGRHITLTGGTASNNVLLGADGHQSAENYGGDGGAMSFDAGGDIRVDANVRLQANAAPPDGFADALEFSAEGSVELEGTIVAKGRGTWGGGGLVDVEAGRDVRMLDSATFELTGGAAGGDLMVDAIGSFSFDGNADVSGGADGIGGRIVTVAGDNASVTGAWTTAGRESIFTVGEIFVEGCRVRIDGQLANDAEAGRNRIVAHDSVAIASSASVIARGDRASNTILYRRVSAPPAIAGFVSPAAALSFEPALSACAVCGNGELEAGEGCDDGNASSADGCSPRCEDEGCEADTSGYPAAPLCDDANDCTIDRCNVVTHHCEHEIPDAGPLAIRVLRVRPGREDGAHSLLVRASFPAALLPAQPAESGMRVIVTGDAASLVDATVPAGALVESGAGWRFSADDGAATPVETLSLRVSKSAVHVTARMDGLDLADAESAGPLRLALRFGDEPGAGVCLGSAPLECRGARRRLRCESAGSS